MIYTLLFRNIYSHLKVVYEVVKTKKSKSDDNRRRRRESDNESDNKKSNKKGKIFKDLKEKNQWNDNVSIVLVYSNHFVFVEVTIAETESSYICAVVKINTNSFYFTIINL